MKRFLILLLPIILAGAGCFGGSSGPKTNDGGVFKTVNVGEEWGQIVLVPTAQGIGTLATTNVINMEMDPQDNNFIYIATRKNGMLYSEDAGNSWRQVRHKAFREGLVLDIKVDPKNVCNVYVAKGSRVYSTKDCMRTFSSETYLETRDGVKVNRISIDWYNSNTIWIGLSNGDVLRSDDKGDTWQTVLKSGGEVSEILISNVDTRNVIVSTFNSGIRRTTDGGQNWEVVESNIEKLQRAKEVFTMTQNKNSSVVLAATTYGLLRSKDFGLNWEPLELLTSPGQLKIKALAIDPIDPKRIYFAANSIFYRSADAGVTWKTERFPSNRIPRVLVVDPKDSSVLYVGVAAPVE